MRVVFTVGVQDPAAVDCGALEQTLPRGRVSVVAVKGGLDIPNPETGGRIVVASAAVEAFLPKQSGWVLRETGG